MSVVIHKVLPQDGDLPLFRRYPTQFQPQPAYLELDETGRAALGISDIIGTGVPEAVWHQRTLRFHVSPYLSRAACERLLEDPEVLALLERIHAGHRVMRQLRHGRLHRAGELTPEARRAAAALQQRLDKVYASAPYHGYLPKQAERLTQAQPA